jgi:hypothetical protein
MTAPFLRIVAGTRLPIAPRSNGSRAPRRTPTGWLEITGATHGEGPRL